MATTAASVDEILVPSPADFHVHLRQPPLSHVIAPHVARGGMHLAYVMPNTVPPLTTVDAALEYLAHLGEILAQDKEHQPPPQLMGTLYLSPDLTPQEVHRAAASGVIHGVKSYPRGVTTNSDGGIENYEVYYPVCQAMQDVGLVLNLHGEVPSDPEQDISVLNAEAKFLTHLHKIHAAFPRLRIVLEHATTAAAVEAVKACGDTVACTITPHHLVLTVDDWAGRPIHFCKPVAKQPSDRKALQDVIKQGHPRFFLGSDSAPHPIGKKLPQILDHGGAGAASQQPCAAGVYTSAILLPLCAHVLESFGALDRLPDYASRFGRAFYGVPAPKRPGTGTGAGTGTAVEEERYVRLRRTPVAVEASYAPPDGEADQGGSIVPLWAGKQLAWSIAG